MDFSEIDDTLCCLFSGHLDGNYCSEIEDELMRLVADFKNNREDARLVFDLSEVKYISSPFLRLCLIQCKNFGKDRFSVTNVSEEILQVFHFSSLIEIMNISLSQ